MGKIHAGWNVVFVGGFRLLPLRARMRAHILRKIVAIAVRVAKDVLFCYTIYTTNDWSFTNTLSGKSGKVKSKNSKQCFLKRHSPTEKKAVDNRYNICYTIYIRDEWFAPRLTKRPLLHLFEKDKKGGWHFCLFLLYYKSSRNCSLNF